MRVTRRGVVKVCSLNSIASLLLFGMNISQMYKKASVNLRKVTLRDDCTKFTEYFSNTNDAVVV